MTTLEKDGKLLRLPECFGKLHCHTESVCSECPANSECEVQTDIFNQNLANSVRVTPSVEEAPKKPRASRLLSALGMEQKCFVCEAVIPEGAQAIHLTDEGFKHVPGECFTTVSATPA